MAKLGYGYGSDFHLLRFLGRHRNYFDSLILSKLGYSGKKIDWLDFKFDKSQFPQDREYIGIEFLENEKYYKKIEQSWKGFWPSPRNAQNWDAVGKIDDEWILVEAKAHKDEIRSNSSASKRSRQQISLRFDQIKQEYKIATSNDWCENYYQKANRILFLDFMIKNNLKARLLFVYFINGYQKKNGEQLGVTSKKEWSDLINQQDSYLGISNSKNLKTNIIDLIIDVAN